MYFKKHTVRLSVMMEVVGSLYDNMMYDQEASSRTSEGSVPREYTSELAFSLSQVRTLFYPCVSCLSSDMLREKESGTVRDVALALRPPFPWSPTSTAKIREQEKDP